MRTARFVALRRARVRQEIPKPEIRYPNDVIVDVAGAGVGRTELQILDGEAPLQPPPRPPYTLGHENAERVRERLPRGERAIGLGWPTGPAVFGLRCGGAVPVGATVGERCSAPLSATTGSPSAPAGHV